MNRKRNETILSTYEAVDVFIIIIIIIVRDLQNDPIIICFKTLYYVYVCMILSILLMV